MENETKTAGRPQHAPTGQMRRQVEMMAAFGNTEEQICQIINISKPTLRLHYREELDIGFVKASNAVAMNLWRQATKDDPKAFPAMAFWLKCRAGWSEYSPKPEPKPEPLGKKEIAQLEAETAGVGTEWGHLVN